MARRLRVVAVGGGATGLAAAVRLAGRADVVLLEARDRLGGRVETRTPSCSSGGAGEVAASALRSAARGLARPARALEEALDAATVVDWSREALGDG